MKQHMAVLADKILLGKSMTMSLIHNRTPELWRQFMMAKSSIKQPVGREMYSLQVYPPGYFEPFNPGAEFVKWAAVEVSGHEDIPEGMDTFSLPGGLYAVFLYKGALSTAAEAFRYIFMEWLPKSGYVLDNRPHFELLGEKYRNDHPDSEEEIWVPVRERLEV